MPWIPFKSYKPNAADPDDIPTQTVDVVREVLVSACKSALADLKSGNLYGQAAKDLEFALELAQRTEIP